MQKEKLQDIERGEPTSPSFKPAEASSSPSGSQDIISQEAIEVVVDCIVDLESEVNIDEPIDGDKDVHIITRDHEERKKVKEPESLSPDHLLEPVQPSTSADPNKGPTECWICYDSDRTDAGPLIQPCSCRGDLSAAHHECLRLWLMESNSNPEHITCKVCGEAYNIQRGSAWLISALTTKDYITTSMVVTFMCALGLALWFVVQHYESILVRTVSLGFTFLTEYKCLKFLGFNFISAHNRAKFATIKIIGRKLYPNRRKSRAAAAAAAAAAKGQGGGGGGSLPVPGTSKGTSAGEITSRMSSADLVDTE